MDHDPFSANGHDVYSEGIHVDVYHRGTKQGTFYPDHGPLPESSGQVIRRCKDYLIDNTAYIEQVRTGDIDPHNPLRF